MEHKYLSFGPLGCKFEGELSLLEGSLLARFFAEPCEPDFTVSLKRCKLPPLMAPARCLLSTADTETYETEQGWHRRFFAKEQGVRREYAVLDYTDCSAELKIALHCRNAARCVESCIAFEHLALSAGALPIHASHIRTPKGSIIFTAPSGTGKSTQAALWERYRGAEIINGDKTLLFPAGEPVLASGLPYAGTSNICRNAYGPLQAIVVLEQGKENRLEKLKAGRAVMALMSGVIYQSWHERDRERALELTIKTAEKVPVFRLSCLPEESAVSCLEQALRKE